MRWLFLFVLLVNIAYVAWQVSAPKEVGELTAPTIRDTKPIVLLSERELSPVNKKVSLKTEVQSPEQQVPGVQVSEKGAATKGTIASQVAKENSDEVLDTAPVAMESPIESSVVEQVQADVCYTVGPFHELEKLREFVKEIKSYVTNAEFRNREEKKLTVYWVYINPEKSRRDARKLGKRLKTNKIKDFYIIRTGEKNNGISLGHFNSKYRASKLAKKVKKLGFDVELEPVFKSYTVYWLDYQIASDKSIPQSIFDKYIKSAKKDKISLLTRECVVN